MQYQSEKLSKCNPKKRCRSENTYVHDIFNGFTKVLRSNSIFYSIRITTHVVHFLHNAQWNADLFSSKSWDKRLEFESGYPIEMHTCGTHYFQDEEKEIKSNRSNNPNSEFGIRTNQRKFIHSISFPIDDPFIDSESYNRGSIKLYKWYRILNIERN